MRLVLYEEKKNFPIYCLGVLLPIFMLIFHTYEGVLLALIALIYFLALTFNASEKLLSIYYLLVTFFFVFVLLQKFGLLIFTEHFMLSKFLFGEKYVGASLPGMDVTFNDKWNYLLTGNTPIVFYISLIGLLVIPLLTKKAIPFLIATVVGLIIYFLPEGHFSRVSFLLPFFPLVLSSLLFFSAKYLSLKISKVVFKDAKRKKYSCS
jgi:hypothetical protein